VCTRFGPAVIIPRKDLLELLYSRVKDCVPFRFCETVEAITQDRDGVDVTVCVCASSRCHSMWVRCEVQLIVVPAQFGSGDTQRFDLVVGADGIKSQVRTLVMGIVPVTFWNIRGWYASDIARSKRAGSLWLALLMCSTDLPLLLCTAVDSGFLGPGELLSMLSQRSGARKAR
jgi:hypothetical protein